MSKPAALCTIIARGGGSTFYRKNTYPLLGKPVIAWAIEALQQTNFITELAVWSEDDKILSIARKMGACALKRPKDMVHYASGFKTREECYIARMNQVKKEFNRFFDYHVGFNCNYVLFKPETMNAMFSKLEAARDKASSIQSVYRVDPGLCAVSPASGELFPIWNDTTIPNCKQPPLFRLAGMSIGSSLRCADSKYSSMYHEISAIEGLDFQTEEDIIPAEFYLSKRLQSTERTGG